jgi:hypothetical protein
MVVLSDVNMMSGVRAMIGTNRMLSQKAGDVYNNSTMPAMFGAIKLPTSQT